MKALIDTNIVLDDALAREPFATDAVRITEACARGDVEGYLSAITPLNAFYVARKTVGTERARKMVGQLLVIYSICLLSMLPRCAPLTILRLMILKMRHNSHRRLLRALR